MSGSNQPSGWRTLGCLLGVVGLALASAGCGSDGNVSVALRPTPAPIVGAVTGTVFAPNGDFASAAAGIRWACPFSFVSPAYAQTCLQVSMPAAGTLNVVLWLIDTVDAKDGEIDNPRKLNEARTDGDGLYQIVDPAAEQLDQLHLMVVVGSGDSMTRAFAIEHTTNIDAVSEATVRVVLDRMTQSPPVQLSSFANEALANILDKASAAACSAKGDTVADLNQSAYDHAKVNCGVLQAINDATGVPVTLPAKCASSS